MKLIINVMVSITNYVVPENIQTSTKNGYLFCNPPLPLEFTD